LKYLKAKGVKMCLAYPMKVREIRGKYALVEAPGVRKEVNIEFLKDVKVGDYIMVHAGFAIEKFDKKEAEKTLKIFKQFLNDL
jgi:hydrogenase expression/formation protein HypC